MKTLTHDIRVEDSHSMSFEAVIAAAERQAKDRIEILTHQPSDARLKFVSMEIDMLAWVNREFCAQRIYDFKLEIKI